MTRSSRLGFLFVISFALFIVIVFSIPAKAQAFCFLGYGNTCPKETEEITRDQALDTYCQWLISDGSFGKNLGTCTTEMADTFEYPRVQYCFSQHPNDMQAFDSCWADGGDTPGNDPFLAESRALDRSLYSSFPVDEALARSRALDRNTPSSGLFGPSAGKDKFQIADEYQDAVNAGLPQAEVDARFKAVMAGPKSAAPLPRGFQIKPAAPSTVPAVPSAQPDIDYATNQSFQQACALEDPIGSRAYNSCLNRLYQTYLGGNPLRSTAPQQTFPTGLDSGADFESAASPSTGKRAGGIIEQAKPSRAPAPVSSVSSQKLKEAEEACDRIYQDYGSDGDALVANCISRRIATTPAPSTLQKTPSVGARVPTAPSGGAQTSAKSVSGINYNSPSYPECNNLYQRNGDWNELKDCIDNPEKYRISTAEAPAAPRVERQLYGTIDITCADRYPGEDDYYRYLQCVEGPSNSEIAETVRATGGLEPGEWGSLQTQWRAPVEERTPNWNVRVTSDEPRWDSPYPADGEAYQPLPDEDSSGFFQRVASWFTTSRSEPPRASVGTERAVSWGTDDSSSPFPSSGDDLGSMPQPPAEGFWSSLWNNIWSQDSAEVAPRYNQDQQYSEDTYKNVPIGAYSDDEFFPGSLNAPEPLYNPRQEYEGDVYKDVPIGAYNDDEFGPAVGESVEQQLPFTEQPQEYRIEDSEYVPTPWDQRVEVFTPGDDYSEPWWTKTWDAVCVWCDETRKEPERKFADPFSPELYNQSLVSGAFGAFLLKSK